MATTKRHRNAAFVPTEVQQDAIDQFNELVDNETLKSTRRKCQWLAANVPGMTTGDIAVFLDVRFQQVYQAIKK